MPVSNSSNLSQISGLPMCNLDILPAHSALPKPPANLQGSMSSEKERTNNRRGLSDIRFVRHRMLYTRPAVNKGGAVKFGLNQIHVFNRCRNAGDPTETRHVMKYMFPAQFGLHNALSSNIDPKTTAQPLKDYTLREQEIGRKDRVKQFKHPKRNDSAVCLPPSLPRRLRGNAEELIRRVRKRHQRCAYAALLDHYCPRSVDQTVESSLGRASTAAQVSAFCRAVVNEVFPGDLWLSNGRLVDRNIDRFVRLRRYETMSLHDVLQGMRIAEVKWMASPHTKASGHLSKSDMEKRQELMAELLYYVFDSFLIPLIRGHFHVTESNVQRNQLFFFRHDVWLEMSEPALASLKCSMLEECTPARLQQIMTKRSLGVSQIRLLPKEHGMRPIINLRRRVQKLQFGQLVLGKSINTLLAPTFSVLNYSKDRTPSLLGSALFSADDIFPRLQLYRQILERGGNMGKPLYFAKVDVKACFDTIPQKRLLQLAEQLVSEDQYQIVRYSRAKLTGGHNKDTPGFGAKPSWKFLTRATAGCQIFDFQHEMQTDTSDGRTRSVYINGVAQRSESRRALLALLEEHVGANLIKVGKRIYRQKQGIPQGSILSSLLCSFFYAELERDVLGFVDDGRSVLLRLIDDFMVISTERSVATRFLKTMHAGIPEFGVTVKLEKSRANFDVAVQGQRIAVIANDKAFPYCGNAIDTRTLDISKDQERRLRSNIADSGTVEYSRLAGQSFYRKTLNALKLQMQAMLLSTSYNSVQTVLSNLTHSFSEVAQKAYHYIKSLPPGKQPDDRLIIRVVEDAIALAFVLMKRRKKTSKDVVAYECSVTSAQTRWLACSAFIAVFGRKQTKHHRLLEHLGHQVQGVRMEKLERRLLDSCNRR